MREKELILLTSRAQSSTRRHREYSFKNNGIDAGGMVHTPYQCLPSPCVLSNYHVPASPLQQLIRISCYPQPTNAPNERSACFYFYLPEFDLQHTVTNKYRYKFCISKNNFHPNAAHPLPALLHSHSSFVSAVSWSSSCPTSSLVPMIAMWRR